MKLDDLMYRPGLLAGQRILVTGGGTGLGRVMAEAFLLLGATVYICGRRGSVLEETAAELTAAHGGRVVPVACDIRDAEAIAAMVAFIWADGGPLTGLVNNAAGNFISRTEDLSSRGFDAIANIVFRGSFLTTLECGKRWLAAGDRASVLSILVTWVHNGSPFTVPSAMSKAGIHAMTQSLAVEWAGRGVRFNAIAPGPFPTEGMSKRLTPTDDGSAFMNLARNPTGRVGAMAELANLAVFLMAPGADYVNGQTIAIDGGDFLATGANFNDLRQWSDDDWSRARAAIQATTAADKAKRSV
ncbi:SDR family oxidoreductase [Zavarzinia compransoris]|uniref:Short-chain dehydrogenase n=1 Tax=Zavarzinia compransoris TaxID=1264899 RepID=A0A317E3C3_9PROT|nr:SDR family oxidoreductase [Zavarzinia compransoris]PWR20646.1 short-chain dehydrogenase [Zavarzinia compransoris]TDP44535.1 NAD(P)-dependent dehydrogenase (short-subunit alcohol dehydrogenase family) [Zavarzinia compransoris]